MSFQFNVLATIQDTTFIMANGYIFILNNVDLSMMACRVYYSAGFVARIHVTESRLSIYDSSLR